MSSAPPPNDDDDDFELELEAVDPEILAHERARIQQKTEDVLAKVDAAELYQAPDRTDYDFDWEKLRQFKFTTRHLLIVTAVLAFGLTLVLWFGLFMAMFVAAIIAVGVGWFSVIRRERREAAERERLRCEFDAARAASSIAVPQGASAVIDVEPPPPRAEFRFAFSIKQIFITMTVAAVLLGLLRIAGPKAVIITLGALSLIGIAVQTFGWFDLPPVVVFGWWMMMVLYLALGLLTAFFPRLLSDGGTPAMPHSTTTLYRDC